MAWFNLGGGAASAASDDDVALEGLRALLDRLATQLPDGRRKRLDKLRERLDRPPLPTGLVRELENVWREMRLDTGRTRNGHEAISEMARSLLQTMRIAALFDEQLEQQIIDASRELPNEMGPADARLLMRKTGEIKNLAVSARDRMREEREALGSMVRSLGDELQGAVTTSDEVNLGLRRMATSLSRQTDPSSMKEVHKALLKQVRDLSKDMTGLQHDLGKAQRRSEKLENLVAEQARLLVDARTEASLDPLTGVCNRGAFDTALEDRVSHAHNTEQELSLLMLDLDHFKQLNDKWGHTIGDRMLKAAATAINDQVRRGDIVGRVGGEEFAVLLPGASFRVAASVGERIRAAIADIRILADDPRDPVQVTVSAGGAHLQPDETGPQIYKRADKALYAAKHSGRNQLHMEGE